MANGTRTKKALADSLRTLMEIQPVDRISIAEICASCGLTRKSFYYHFMDKYDLINWIFETEFALPSRSRSYGSDWEILEDLCCYLYENRSFYRRVLRVQGQNSFYEYLQGYLRPLVQSRCREIMGESAEGSFYSGVAEELVAGAIKRWLQEGEIPPKEYVELMKTTILQFAGWICRTMA